MKTSRKLLLAGIMVALASSIGYAQMSYSNSQAGATLIYSNSFTGSGSVNITNTTPDFTTSLLGGSTNAAWLDAGGSGDTNAMYANGTVGTGQGDTWILPFTPVSGYVYTLSATVNMTANPGSWVVAGYFQNYSVPGIANSAPNGTGLNPYAWTLRNWSGNTEYFSTRTVNVYNSTPPSPTGSYHTYTQILDTTGPKWITTAFFDGTPLGSPYNYGGTVPIHAIGLGQHVLGNPSGYQWTSLTLSAAPIVILEQPVSANVDVGAAFTNTVAVAAANPSFQWFKNDAPISGATNASLIFNPAATGDTSTNYYVVITNNYGAVTSTVASVTVYTTPVFSSAYPVAYTNTIALYGGSNAGGTNGSSPVFSVATLGGQPITYQWQTNGVDVAGATNAGFTFTNCQSDSPTSFACVASNSYGTATQTWSVSYVQSPPASFPQAILGDQPIGFWRLNEGPDDFAGDDGVIASDYASGNNGLYTNAVVAYAGYTNTDPTDASARFGYYDAPHSDVYGIQGIDFSNTTNATFSVQGWVNGSASQPNGACILAKGYNGGEQFALDVNGGKYRFLVRNRAGTASSVTATNGPDGNWHFIVGVCDEVHGTISLYVDGLTVGSAPITSGSGILANSSPITIGARGSSAGDLDSVQFYGYLSDLAVYNQALSPGQVADLWIAAGFSVGFSFVPPAPPTNYVFLTDGTIDIPATVFGSAPMGYYWTNLTTGTVMASGTTNAFGSIDNGILNATLIYSNAPASLSGDQLELIVTNASSSTNLFVSLFSPAPPVTLDYSSPILYSNYFNGGTWNVAGMPLTAVNALVGGTNATWNDSLGTNSTGMLQANGTPTTGQGDSWTLPFTPHAGYIYTLTATVTLPAYPGSWIGLGFAGTPVTDVSNGRFGSIPVEAWEITTAGGTQNLQAFAGGGTVANTNNFYPALPTTLTNTVVLDTTAAHWTVSFYVDGVLAKSYTYTSNPTIGSVGITQNGLSAPQNIQWNSFSLTQVAPNGAAPYLLDPQPPTSVTLQAGSPLSISATAFSSFAPYGYTWSNTNTAAVLGSGATNSVDPLAADLNVASVPSSWDGNTLALIVTNAYGTSISLVSLTVTNAIIIPTNQPTITSFSLINGSNVMINGTNGQSGATYYLLGSTNLATPLSQWLPVATNVIVTNGTAGNGFTFTATNAVGVTIPQEFYILSSTN